MFRTINVAGKQWWVPENRGWTLAVQIDSPDQYEAAVNEKLWHLLQEAGLKRAQAAVRMCAGDFASTIYMENLDELRVNLPCFMPVAVLIQSGAPEHAEPAPADEARGYVEAQSELDLENFLTFA